MDNIEFLDCIAKGFNPITGEKIPESDLIRSCDFVGRLEDLVRELRKDLDLITVNNALSTNNTFTAIKIEPGLTISAIAKNINNVYQLGSNKIMQKITDFLLKEEFLIPSKNINFKGKPAKRATTKGKQIGIVNEDRVSEKGHPYIVPVYSVEAQEYIISKLTEILN